MKKAKSKAKLVPKSKTKTKKKQKGKVLVTGSAGFVAKNVFNYLKENGWKVYHFDKALGHDLLEDEHLKKELAKVDYVCHLAAIGDVYLAAQNPALASHVSVGGTANLVKVANTLPNVKKIVYASTWEVYGHPHYEPLDEKHPTNPDHPYSIAKHGGEMMITHSKLNKIPWIVLRLGTAYGPHMRPNAVIPLFINKAKKGEAITISGDGSQIRQFTHARDIARAFELAMESDISGEVFNITSSEIQTIKQLAELVDEHIGVTITYGPERAGDVPPAKVTSAKAKKKLGWEPKTKFKDGFIEIVELMK